MFFFYYFLSQPRCLAVTVRRWSINPISGCRIFGGKAPDGEHPSDKGRISGGYPLSGYQVFDCPLSDRVARHGNRFPILIGSSLIVKGNVRIPLAAPTLLLSLSLSLIYAPIAQPRESFSVLYSWGKGFYTFKPLKVVERSKLGQSWQAAEPKTYNGKDSKQRIGKGRMKDHSHRRIFHAFLFFPIIAVPFVCYPFSVVSSWST